MTVFLTVVGYLLWVYWLLLLARLILELVGSFARDWRPKGAVVIIVETVFTLTDPPIKLLRRVIPPLNIGAVRLDLSLMITLILVLIARQIVMGFAAG
ncbi:MAG TPA: YggT family protein [Gordonia sp. (in: high G+C Gram-positive bacteria)]|uniref:YggT family protein n=1 Tax=Gordonia sp. (in: high G+C Gram-positive bacteria) TaxID=84139 RepID=UPI00262031CF|nr:YggT family protein [Gordonia sp. (in: high G+C Gram-positive bacteria)]HNP59034.1 YggT family protein [Gordonia sp. (in: high G+C Gram-positive bacteria)]HRC52715.1 YggT family protein [Gordonia sp. (in: high G+C Gram-positive bacteria)]